MYADDDDDGSFHNSGDIDQLRASDDENHNEIMPNQN